jgi:hypothetical protein
MLAMTALGQSVPSFAPPVSYPAPGASAAAAGDFDGDGRVDVVTANGVGGSQGVSILLTNSDGSLQAARNFVTGSGLTAVVVGDFNGDGHMDVAAADKATNTLSILLGNGDGTLQSATSIGLAGVPTSIFASDLNGDGESDLVLVLQTGLPHLDAILLSNGDGTFSQSTFAGPPGVVVADFNNDGKPDLCVYGFGVSPADALIKFGNGDGTFTDSPVPFTLGVPFEANLAVAGDFNGDGKMDLYGEFVSGAFTRAGFVFSTYTALGNGDGTFSVSSTGVTNSGIGGENLLVGDFNRDGKLDVAGIFPGPAATRLAQTLPPSKVRIIYGRGDGSFINGANNVRFEFPASTSTAMFTGAPLVTADFDGNGAPDFAWASGSGVTVIRNANGNPPLLSGLSVNSKYVVGGEQTVSATATVGDPAPVGGAVVALASGDGAVSFPAGSTVTIPEGATSATFDVSTSAVAAVDPVTITASWNGVNQSASFNVIPAFGVSTLKLASPSLFGLFGGLNTTPATVTLSGPAADGTVVNLASSNPALVAVPASVAVAPGATTATFTARVLTNVPVNTLVTISASFQGATASGILNVLAASDRVNLAKAEYVVSKKQWTIEATDSDPTNVRVEVFTQAGVDLGSLVFQGGGKFKGQGVFAGPFTSVVLQSFKGGNTTGAVAQK